MKYRYGHGMNKQDLKLISANHPQITTNTSYTYCKYTKPHVGLHYQSNQGSQVILIRLKWGVLSVSHIFLEQLGTGITLLSSGTTHKLDCTKQRKGPCCDKEAKPSPSRYWALIPQVSLDYQSLIDSPGNPPKKRPPNPRIKSFLQLWLLSKYQKSCK